MIQGVLFDLGDTLLDFEPVDTRAVFRIAAQNAYEHLRQKAATLPPFESFFRAQFRAMRWQYFIAKLRGREFNTADLLRRLCQKIGYAPDDQTLRELAWQWYCPLCEYASVADDVFPTLQTLKDRGLRLGIVSNTFVPGQTLDRHLEMVGLLAFLPVRVYSSEVGYRKPHRRIFEIALEMLKSSAAQTLFVGDLVKTDIVGARRAGMRTILKAPLANSRGHRVAHHTIRRLSEMLAVLDSMDDGETTRFGSMRDYTASATEN